jgi:hypothetical protein
MTKLLPLSVAAVLCIILCGCDGFTMRKASIDLSHNVPTSSGTAVQTGDLKGFFKLIKDVAVKNGLKCHAYSEAEKYFGCGAGTFNLMTYVKGDKSVQVELSEFGPWGKTRQFEKLERDVNEMLAREFPAQNIVLSKEK